MGEPVDDAYTEVTFPEKGEYYVYVRTYNWTSPWKKGAGAVHIQTFRLKAVRSFFSKSFTLRLSFSFDSFIIIMILPSHFNVNSKKEFHQALRACIFHRLYRNPL